MRIVFFNVWHGFVKDKLYKFLEEQKTRTDIFCLFETDPNINSEIYNNLPEFNSVFDKGGLIKYHGGIFDSQSIFVKHNLRIIMHQRVDIYTPTDQDASGLNILNIKAGDKSLLIGAVHGTARPGNKLDTEERIAQSQKILDQFKDNELPIIIGGDFNLLPQTTSIKMFEDAGYRNLIKEFEIKSTRNQLCWDQFPEEIKKDGKQYHADYSFVSSNVKVNNFEVPCLEASDHEPLILDFEI